MKGFCLDLLHGFLGRAADWDPVLDALRGLGVEVSARAPELLRDVEQARSGFDGWSRGYCEAVRREPAARRVLVGYSMGGRLALHALARAPELWRAAVLISTNPGILAEPYVQGRRARRAWEADWSRRFLHDDWDALMADWNALPVFAGARVKRVEAEHDREVLAAALQGWSLTRHTIRADELDALKGTALSWVFGQSDAKFRDLAAVLQERGAPGSFTFLPGGHRLPAESPRALAELIAAVLRAIAER